MTNTERDIQSFILRAMARAAAPVLDSTLREMVKTGFSHIAFTASDLTKHISRPEESGLITGTNDEVFGLMWGLTPKGKIAAQQLG